MLKEWGEYAFTPEQGEQFKNLCAKPVQELAAIIVINDAGCRDCKIKDAQIEKYRKAMAQKADELNNQKRKIDNMIEFMRSRRMYYDYAADAKKRKHD